MERREFEKLVRQAAASLPKRVRDYLKNNVALCVEQRREDLLGLYEGVPEVAWGKGFGGELPAKITLFQEALEEEAKTKEELFEEVRQTLWHEIAHQAGFGDEELEEMEEGA